MILRAISFVLGLLASAAHAAAPPAIDGEVGKVVFENDFPARGIVSVSGVLTTTQAPDIIVCVVAISAPEGSPNRITSCTGTGLTFALRKQYDNDMDLNCGSANPCNLNLEVWEATAAAPLAGVTITANFASELCAKPGDSGCRASFVAFGVSGTVGHDPNPSLPNTSFSSPSVPTATSGVYTTSFPVGLLLWYYGSASAGQAACLSAVPVVPAFVIFGSQAFPTANCLNVAYLPVTNQVNAAYSSPFGGRAFNIIGDAFTATGGFVFPQVWINE